MTHAVVISAMHTGTQWLVRSLRDAGVEEIRFRHTFGDWPEMLQRHSDWPVLVPTRDPALAMISFENRQPQSGRCEAIDFGITDALIDSGAIPIPAGDTERLSEVLGVHVPDVGYVNTSEDRTGWKQDYLENGRLHGWVAREMEQLWPQ